MTVDIALIKRLAETAALEIPPEELEVHRQTLENMAAYTARLGKIDTAGLPLMTHPFGETGANRLREDKVTNEDHAKEFTAAAPDSKENHFRVPRTIEE